MVAASTALLLPPKAAGWWHGGHPITAVGEAEGGDGDGDEYGRALCEECSTLGDYYRINGDLYIQVEHLPKMEPSKSILVGAPTIVIGSPKIRLAN